MSNPHRLAFALMFAQIVAACGGGVSNTSPPVSTGVPAPPSTTASTTRSYYFGNASINAAHYFAEALLTRDGAIRLYVAGPHGIPAGPAISAQFVGQVAVRSNQVSGSGTIVGQGCAGPDANRFCRQTAAAEIRATLQARELTGEIHVTGGEGDEVWALSLSPHDLFLDKVRVGTLAGQYTEIVAEFARQSDTVVNLDSAGRMFFQSPGSGCTGNGALAERPDGSFNIYDVTLTIESCNAPYAYLNGEFAGLASPAANGWDYSSFLLNILLSRPDAAASQVAIAMSGVTEL